MPSSPTLRPTFALIGAAVIVAIASCTPNNDGPGENSDNPCKTMIDVNGNPPTSPAPGALTLHGSFYPDETVELGYSDPVTGNPRLASATPATARTSLTLTGLPSGTRFYPVTFSCGSNGTHSYGSFSFTVQ